MGYFDGLAAWVTGGGRGIGRAAALALASQGAAVAVIVLRSIRTVTVVSCVPLIGVTIGWTCSEELVAIDQVTTVSACRLAMCNVCV